MSIPGNCGSFHTHCFKSVALLKFVKNNLQQQNCMLLYKQLQMTWLFVQSAPCYT